MSTNEFMPEWALNTNTNGIALNVASAGDALKALAAFDARYYDYLMQHCQSAMIVDQKKQLATYFSYVGLWAYTKLDHIEVYTRSVLPVGSLNTDLFGDNTRWNLQTFLRSLQPFLSGHIQLIAVNDRNHAESYVFDQKGDCYIYQGHTTKVR